MRRVRRTARWPAAFAVLIVAPLLLLAPAPATADDTPIGIDVLSDSAVTKHGTAGTEFANLEVTVSQTKDITYQGLTVTWRNFKPTPADTIGQNMLSIMQCWGNPADSWFRETCQYGSGIQQPGTWPPPGPALSNSRSIGLGNRKDPVDQATFPDDAVMFPFRSAKGGRVGNGGKADPFPAGADPSTTSPDIVLAPFFDKNKTNEIPYAVTAGDGSGRSVFEAQTSIEAPDLGCGKPRDGAVQPCYLEVVPRGELDPVTHQSLAGTNLPVDGSPLTGSLWANRIEFRLDFRSVDASCPIGQAERRTVGSELVGEAIRAWQPVLCANNGPVYGYNTTSDAEAARQVLLGTPLSPGLGFTSEPVVSPPGGPPMVHAPVALSGVVIGFNIDHVLDPGPAAPDTELLRAKQVSSMRLTPRLVAKLLTLSYQRDVPGGDQADYLNGNPRTILRDKEFTDLNPDFLKGTKNRDIQPLMLPIGSSAAGRAVWRWILADDSARKFLGGTAEDFTDPVDSKAYHMVVNKYYKSLGVDGDVPDSFGKLDQSCTQADAVNVPDLLVCALNKAPYTASLSAGAAQTLRADTKAQVQFDIDKWNASQKQIVQLKPNGPQPPGSRWVMALTDTASAGRYGLYSAALLNGPGEFVAPTAQSLLRGATSMVPTTNPDVIAMDPAKKAAGAYPLTMVTYAAADPSRDTATRHDYARLVRYAAGDGQVAGRGPGQLPPGYVPLPDALRAKARSAATVLEQGWTPPGATNTTGTGNGNGAAPPANVPDRGAVPVPSASTRGSLSPVPVAATRTTPSDPVGWPRYLLPGVVAAGALAGLLGPVLLSIAGRRARRRV